MPKTKAPAGKQSTDTKPRALGEDDHFGEQTFARGLKAVTTAIEQAAKEQDLKNAKKSPAKKKH